MTFELLTKSKEPETEIVGGWVGDQLDKANEWTSEKIQELGKAITDAIYNGFIAIMDTLCDFIFVASEIGIVACIIVYIASRDKKAISLGWKLGLAYFVTAVVKGEL